MQTRVGRNNDLISGLCCVACGVFQGKDHYNNEVTHLARPLPVEYLLVDMPAAFPSEFQYTFKTIDGVHTFPAENREHMGETQVPFFFLGGGGVVLFSTLPGYAFFFLSRTGLLRSVVCPAVCVSTGGSGLSLGFKLKTLQQYWGNDRC